MTFATHAVMIEHLANRFKWDKESKTAYIQKRDIEQPGLCGGPPHPWYDFIYDTILGFNLKNGTNSTQWELADYKKWGGDIFQWEFLPTEETQTRFPSVRGWRCVVMNVDES